MLPERDYLALQGGPDESFGAQFAEPEPPLDDEPLIDDEQSGLLDEIAAFLTRYVAFPSDEAVTAVALWVVHCHAVDAFESTPRLALLSPEKGSGKTRTLEVLALVVPVPIHAVNMSAAALYRVVADKHPTLLLDEADSYLGITIAKQHEDLRGLINAGHRRGATVYRGEVSGKAVKVVEFPAYAACALAGIGDLPDTILDRAVIVPMKRRAPDEQVEPFRERLARPGADELREQIRAWADQHFQQLRDAWPDMPDGITDRAADVWEPLIAIADLAGWSDRARTAAVAITNARHDRDPSLGVQLLSDCRRVFTDRDVDRLTTEQLLEALVELDESPWANLRGQPLAPRGLARRLKPYDVKPGPHRFDEGTKRGYLRENFYDAWLRYLPPVTPVTDVTHPQRNRETAADPSLLGTDLPSIQGSDPLSNTEGPLQAKHTQHEDEQRLAWLDELEVTTEDVA